MEVIGVVGGIGAGKSTVVSALSEMRKCAIIGADEIGHQLLLQEGAAYVPVIEAFGTTILDDYGQIIRSELAKIVFTKPEALQTLNAITHPLIYNEVEKQLTSYKNQQAYDLIIVDAALLIEIGLIKLVDCVIGVYADEETRIDRVTKRDGVTKEQALSRINKQKKWEELQKVITITIDNSGTYEETLGQIKKFLEKVARTY